MALDTTSRPLRPGLLLAWTLVTSATAVAIGMLAHLLKSHFDPLAIQPLVVGAACGGAGAVAMWFMNVGHRAGLIGGLAVVAIVAFTAQEYGEYQEYLAGFKQDQDQVGGMVDLGDPHSMPGFLQMSAGHGVSVFNWRLIGWQVWAYWASEIVLIAVGGWLIIGPLSRQSYCTGCNTWYRAVRQGQVPKQSRKELADEYGLPSEKLSLSYKIYACQTGCGTSALQISWPASGEFREGRKGVWLDDQQYQQLQKLLDPGDGPSGGDGDEAQ